MDKSEKYIEMCKQAIEVQRLWKRDDGDFAYTDGDLDSYPQGTRIIWHSKMTNSGYHDWDSNWYIPEGCVWLPRQDQLQEILKESHSMGTMIQDLYWFYDPEHFCPESDNEFRVCTCEQKGVERRTHFSTIEQLWLAVVMDEIYKKEWNGIEWLPKDAQDSSNC